jgi:hypothetical protein
LLIFKLPSPYFSTLIWTMIPNHHYWEDVRFVQPLPSLNVVVSKNKLGWARRRNTTVKELCFFIVCVLSICEYMWNHREIAVSLL